MDLSLSLITTASKSSKDMKKSRKTKKTKTQYYDENQQVVTFSLARQNKLKSVKNEYNDEDLRNNDNNVEDDKHDAVDIKKTKKKSTSPVKPVVLNLTMDAKEISAGKLNNISDLNKSSSSSFDMPSFIELNKVSLRRHQFRTYEGIRNEKLYFNRSKWKNGKNTSIIYKGDISDTNIALVTRNSHPLTHNISLETAVDGSPDLATSPLISEDNSFSVVNDSLLSCDKFPLTPLTCATKTQVTPIYTELDKSEHLHSSEESISRSHHEKFIDTSISPSVYDSIKKCVDKSRNSLIDLLSDISESFDELEIETRSVSACNDSLRRVNNNSIMKISPNDTIYFESCKKQKRNNVLESSLSSPIDLNLSNIKRTIEESSYKSNNGTSKPLDDAYMNSMEVFTNLVKHSRENLSMSGSNKGLQKCSSDSMINKSSNHDSIFFRSFKKNENNVIELYINSIKCSRENLSINESNNGLKKCSSDSMINKSSNHDSIFFRSFKKSKNIVIEPSASMCSEDMSTKSGFIHEHQIDELQSCRRSKDFDKQISRDSFKMCNSISLINKSSNDSIYFRSCKKKKNTVIGSSSSMMDHDITDDKSLTDSDSIYFRSCKKNKNAVIESSSSMIDHNLTEDKSLKVSKSTNGSSRLSGVGSLISEDEDDNVGKMPIKNDTNTLKHTSVHKKKPSKDCNNKLEMSCINKDRNTRISMGSASFNLSGLDFDAGLIGSSTPRSILKKYSTHKMNDSSHIVKSNDNLIDSTTTSLVSDASPLLSRKNVKDISRSLSVADSSNSDSDGIDDSCESSKEDKVTGFNSSPTLIKKKSRKDSSVGFLSSDDNIDRFRTSGPFSKKLIGKSLTTPRRKKRANGKPKSPQSVRKTKEKQFIVLSSEDEEEYENTQDVIAGVLDQVYGNSWRSKNLLPSTEPRKRIKKDEYTRTLPQTERKQMGTSVFFSDSKEDCYEDYLEKVRLNLQEFSIKQKDCKDDKEYSEIPRNINDLKNSESIQGKITHPRKLSYSSQSSDSENEKPFSKKKGKRKSHDKIVRKHLPLNISHRSSTKGSDKKQKKIVKKDKNVSKGGNATANLSTPKNTNSNSKNVFQPTPRHTLSFLSSLSEYTGDQKCHPDAWIYKTKYKTKKEELGRKLFALFNKEVFESKLPHDMVIDWSSRMRSTSGVCYNRKIVNANGELVRASRIALSTKVNDAPYRLRDTLIHEMCHAATWQINGLNGGHGPYWKNWTIRATRRFPELPKIQRCHDFDVKTKYTYRCTLCGYSFGRHQKSLDTDRKRCGYCYGKFEVLVNDNSNKPGQSNALRTPKQATGFALFVKENFKDVRAANKHIPHKNVMQLLSKKFAEFKVNNAKQNDNNRDA